jgi:hypothetical protein
MWFTNSTPAVIVSHFELLLLLLGRNFWERFCTCFHLSTIKRPVHSGVNSSGHAVIIIFNIFLWKYRSWAFQICKACGCRSAQIDSVLRTKNTKNIVLKVVQIDFYCKFGHKSGQKPNLFREYRTNHLFLWKYRSWAFQKCKGYGGEGVSTNSVLRTKNIKNAKN